MWFLSLTSGKPLPSNDEGKVITSAFEGNGGTTDAEVRFTALQFASVGVLMFYNFGRFGSGAREVLDRLFAVGASAI